MGNKPVTQLRGPWDPVPASEQQGRLYSPLRGGLLDTAETLLGGLDLGLESSELVLEVRDKAPPGCGCQRGGVVVGRDCRRGTVGDRDRDQNTHLFSSLSSSSRTSAASCLSLTPLLLTRALALASPRGCSSATRPRLNAPTAAGAEGRAPLGVPPTTASMRLEVDVFGRFGRRKFAPAGWRCVRLGWGVSMVRVCGG